MSVGDVGPQMFLIYFVFYPRYGKCDTMRQRRRRLVTSSLYKIVEHYKWPFLKKIHMKYHLHKYEVECKFLPTSKIVIHHAPMENALSDKDLSIFRLKDDPLKVFLDLISTPSMGFSGHPTVPVRCRLPHLSRCHDFSGKARQGLARHWPIGIGTNYCV